MKSLGDVIGAQKKSLKLHRAQQAHRFNQLFNVRESPGTRELLLQAKALVLCGLPYKRTKERIIHRKARLGRHTKLTVTYGAMGENIDMPFGADRALLGWIQTRAYNDGFISFDNLKEFLTAFGLNDGGANYQRFRQRVERITFLHVDILVHNEETGEKIVVGGKPVPLAYYPDTPKEVRVELAAEKAGQLLLTPRKYGFQLDPEFWGYLRENPVPLPLQLMRLFHDKPKSWDFAQFVLYRCFAARSSSIVPWDDLEQQISSTDRNPKQLKYTLNRCLKEIKVAYPTLPAHFLRGYQGLSVAPWRPPEG